MTSGVVVVVVGLLSILVSVSGGPSVIGAVVVEQERGLDGGTMVNISGIWAGGYGACRRATESSLAFIRLTSIV